MTPATTLVCIEERQRRDLELAWTNANLQRAKKLPKSPNELWPRTATPAATPEQADAWIVAMAQSRAAAKDEAKKPPPRKRKKP